MSSSHKYTREIQKPPNVRHFYPGMGFKLSVRVFNVIEITMVRQVRMSPASTAV